MSLKHVCVCVRVCSGEVTGFRFKNFISIFTKLRARSWPEACLTYGRARKPPRTMREMSAFTTLAKMWQLPVCLLPLGKEPLEISQFLPGNPLGSPPCIRELCCKKPLLLLISLSTNSFFHFMRQRTRTRTENLDIIFGGPSEILQNESIKLQVVMEMDPRITAPLLCGPLDRPPPMEP